MLAFWLLAAGGAASPVDFALARARVSHYRMHLWGQASARQSAAGCRFLGGKWQPDPPGNRNER